MSGQTFAMPQSWGEEKDPMSLRLVTADHHPEMMDASDAAPGAGVVIGVFCGSMFWIGIGIGWALWS